jgi:hypothetical protein
MLILSIPCLFVLLRLAWGFEDLEIILVTEISSPIALYGFGIIFHYIHVPIIRDENSFGIFRYSGNRFRNFSIGFIGNGIFRKRNRFSEFSIGIGIGIGVVFYRPFPSVTGFVGNYRICVSEFSGIVSLNFSEFSRMWFFASPVRL